MNQNTEKRSWWQLYWQTLVLGTLAAVTVGLQVLVSRERALTGPEVALFSGVAFGLTIWATFLAARQSTEAAAQASIRPHARSALRRVVTLSGALDRLAALVNRERREFVLDKDEKSFDAILFTTQARQSLDKLAGVVQEQQAAAKDAIEDWSDILPDESRMLKEQYALASRVADLEEKLTKTRGAALALGQAGKAQEERLESAEHRVAELEASLEKSRTELTALQERSPLTIPEGTFLPAESLSGFTTGTTFWPTTMPEAVPNVDVPPDFPSIERTRALSDLVKQQRRVRRISQCSICGRFDAAESCVVCGNLACDSHLTRKEKDPEGPRCLSCWSKSQRSGASSDDGPSAVE
ncbi:MAG: hypothetical protein WD965_07005 [Actinomycetota bacterium]